VATAVNMQQGRFLGDCASVDHLLWYPPLSPAIMAGLAELWDIRVVDCHRWSALLFSWMIPAGLYLVVRLHWGRRAAAAATIALLLTMPWWQREVVQGRGNLRCTPWPGVGWPCCCTAGRSAADR
jgi:hypothetical protein